MLIVKVGFLIGILLLVNADSSVDSDVDLNVDDAVDDGVDDGVDEGVDSLETQESRYNDERLVPAFTTRRTDSGVEEEQNSYPPLLCGGDTSQIVWTSQGIFCRLPSPSSSAHPNGVQFTVNSDDTSASSSSSSDSSEQNVSSGHDDGGRTYKVASTYHDSSSGKNDADHRDSSANSHKSYSNKKGEAYSSSSSKEQELVKPEDMSTVLQNADVSSLMNWLQKAEESDRDVRVPVIVFRKKPDENQGSGDVANKDEKHAKLVDEYDKQRDIYRKVVERIVYSKFNKESEDRHNHEQQQSQEQHQNREQHYNREHQQDQNQRPDSQKHLYRDRPEVVEKVVEKVVQRLPEALREIAQRDPIVVAHNEESWKARDSDRRPVEKWGKTDKSLRSNSPVHDHHATEDVHEPRVVQRPAKHEFDNRNREVHSNFDRDRVPESVEKPESHKWQGHRHHVHRDHDHHDHSHFHKDRPSQSSNKKVNINEQSIDNDRPQEARSSGGVPLSDDEEKKLYNTLISSLTATLSNAKNAGKNLAATLEKTVVSQDIGAPIVIDGDSFPDFAKTINDKVKDSKVNKEKGEGEDPCVKCAEKHGGTIASPSLAESTTSAISQSFALKPVHEEFHIFSPNSGSSGFKGLSLPGSSSSFKGFSLPGSSSGLEGFSLPGSSSGLEGFPGRPGKRPEFALPNMNAFNKGFKANNPTSLASDFLSSLTPFGSILGKGKNSPFKYVAQASNPLHAYGSPMQAIRTLVPSVGQTAVPGSVLAAHASSIKTGLQLMGNIAQGSRIVPSIAGFGPNGGGLGGVGGGIGVGSGIGPNGGVLTKAVSRVRDFVSGRGFRPMLRSGPRKFSRLLPGQNLGQPNMGMSNLHPQNQPIVPIPPMPPIIPPQQLLMSGSEQSLSYLSKPSVGGIIPDQSRVDERTDATTASKTERLDDDEEEEKPESVTVDKLKKRRDVDAESSYQQNPSFIVPQATAWTPIETSSTWNPVKPKDNEKSYVYPQFGRRMQSGSTQNQHENQYKSKFVKDIDNPQSEQTLEASVIPVPSSASSESTSETPQFAELLKRVKKVYYIDIKSAKKTKSGGDKEKDKTGVSLSTESTVPLLIPIPKRKSNMPIQLPKPIELPKELIDSTIKPVLFSKIEQIDFPAVKTEKVEKFVEKENKKPKINKQPVAKEIFAQDFSCKGKVAGFYADYANDCQSYYRCDSMMADQRFDCPKGTKFNMDSLVCDWASSVKCTQDEDKIATKTKAKKSKKGRKQNS